MPTIRVLHFICPTGLHGAERWILALVRHLDPAVVKSHLAVTLEFPGQNIEVRDLFAPLGHGTHVVSMRHRFDLRGVRALVRIVRREGIDLIHTHGYKSDIMGLIAARVAGIRALATPHGFENSREWKLRLFIGLGCASLLFFDRVAPLSNELRQDMVRLGVPRSRIRQIDNGVDLAELAESGPPEKTSVFPPDGRKRIGFVGNLIERKNLDAMIDAFDRLWRRDPNVELVLVGDGPLRRRLESTALARPSGTHVRFMGYRKDRLRVVQALDIFTMTSALEGIPRCMMEAMGLRVPVVAFDIPGVDRLVLPGRTGRLVPFGDAGALAEAWAETLADPSRAKAMAATAHDQIVRRFSASRMAREYQDLYRDMVPLAAEKDPEGGIS
ncbi:MAG: glycosyltransferase family 4 protein [Desulfococcaceae bacterium]